jgi:type II secretory pathway component PulL
VRAEATPGVPLDDVWVYLTPAEAEQLRQSLNFWAEEVEAGDVDPSWHAHVADSGREFALAIEPEPRAD